MEGSAVFVGEICMRKFITVATLLAAVAFITAPLSSSFASEGWYRYMKVPKKEPVAVRSTNNTGPWAVGCGFASAGSLMIGTAIHAGDKNDPRQLTITEAGWHSAACPFLLPWALIGQAICPDNKATYQVARLAFRFVQKHGVGDQSAFTNAYGEACRTGTLSRNTSRVLNSLI
jgi:hypothetical protein